MAESKYRKYVFEDVVGTSNHPEVTTPRIGLGRGLRDVEVDYGFGWSCITRPFTMIKGPHVHEFDQFLVFAGGDPLNMADLRGAEVELYLGEEGEKQVITKPTVVYIPKGLMHCPLIFKTIKEPILFAEIVLSSDYSRKELTRK